MKKLSVEQALLKAKSLTKKGELSEATKLYTTILAAFPNNKKAQQGQAALAKANQSDATQSPPQEAINQLANLFNQGKLAAVAHQAEALTKRYPNSIVIWSFLGGAHQGLGQATEAAKAFRRVTELNPQYSEAHNNLGIALQQLGKSEESVKSFQKALSLKPDYSQAYYNMGIALKEMGKLNLAIGAYQKSLSLDPTNWEAYGNMGLAFKDNGDWTEAVAAYEAALAINPNDADLSSNMGNALKDQGKLEEAIEAYNKSLSLKPDCAEAYNNMGNALKDQGKLEEAIEAYNKALSIKPDYAEALSQAYWVGALMSDWKYISTIKHRIQFEQLTGITSVYGLLALADEPTMHLEKVRDHAMKKYSCTPKCKIKPFQKSKRIKLGYFSSYFRQHPVSILSAQMLELHNKEQFETFAFHYGPDNNDKYNLRIQESFCNFINVSNLSDKDIAELACEKGIDIAIELNGYMHDGRMGILAHRPAPIQINYLAYPGTMGADFYDYIVGDHVVIPKVQRNNYSEKIIYLPNCYMPQDNTRQSSEKLLNRTDCGLPVTGFVFCCFNNSFKISSNEFDIWIRLLKSVEGSIIWLLKTNKWAEENLRSEAEKRGITPSRLVFADKLPLNEHLQRIKHADLFLDTFNFNAHTTASDALWVGLPVVTKIGQGFAARVAGSLLTSIELPELITTSEEEYEALALSLATDPEKLAEIKGKLEHNRNTAPLFDTKTYTKNLERAYTHAYQRYTDGLSPVEFEIL